MRPKERRISRRFRKLFLPSSSAMPSIQKYSKRIERRVDNMIECGLVCEVERLLNEGFRKGITVPGYRIQGNRIRT